MTVCHISSMHPSNDGRIFQRACRGLASKKINIFLVVTHQGDEIINGVNIIGLRSRNGLKRRLFTPYEAFKKALKVKADIYHFHDPDLIPWMLLFRLGGRKVVFDIHENYESRLKKLPDYRFIQKVSFKFYKLIETFICNRFSGIVVVTQSMKNKLKLVKRSVVIVDNLVSLDRMTNVKLNSNKDNQITIYTSGNNTIARNCIQTIEALSLVTAKHSDVKMVFAGRYHPEDYKRELSDRAKELGVYDKIKFLGVVDWEENFTRTSNYQIGCVFYEDNPNNRVTLPNRLYEYMFCGLAVLGEDFPEVRRVINKYECGLLVNSSDPQSIANGIIYLIENPSKLKQMGTNGRNAVLTGCNYENALKGLINFYENILSR